MFLKNQQEMDPRGAYCNKQMRSNWFSVLSAKMSVLQKDIQVVMYSRII